MYAIVILVLGYSLIVREKQTYFHLQIVIFVKLICMKMKIELSFKIKNLM